VSRYQKGKNNLDFTEARDSEWQWHQLGRMQVCTSLQTDNHASTPPQFFTGRMPFLPPNQEHFTQLAVITLVETTDGEMGCDGFSSAKRENLATSRKARKLSKQSFHVVAPVVFQSSCTFQFQQTVSVWLGHCLFQQD